MNFQKNFQYLHWKTKPTRLLSLLWLRNHWFKIQTTTATIKKASNQEASMILLGPGPPCATYRFYQLHSYSVSCLLTSIKLVTGMSDIAATIKSTMVINSASPQKELREEPSLHLASISQISQNCILLVIHKSSRTWVMKYLAFKLPKYMKSLSISLLH